MGELGLLGVTVDPAYGGAGAGHVAYGLVAREVEKIEFRLPFYAVRSILSGHAPD